MNTDNPDQKIPMALHKRKMEELQAKHQERLAQQRTNLMQQFQKRQSYFIDIGRKTGNADYIASTAAQFMRDGDVVLDCGANIGDFSAHFAASPATVIGFEPNPDCVAYYQTRFADRPNMSVECVAVGAQAGEAELLYHAHYTPDVANDKSSEGSSIMPGMDRLLKGRAQTVPVIDLTQRVQGLLDQGRHIAVLKLDIEGSELEVMERFFDLDLFSKIPLCLVETHERNFPELEQRFAAIKEKIAQRYAPAHVFLDWM